MTPDQQWLELYVRLVAGEPAERPFRGTVELTEDGHSVAYRVRKDRHRWRVEDEDGRPTSIQGDRYRFDFGRDSTCPSRKGVGEPCHGEAAQDVVARPDPSDWSLDGDDFTRPAGMPRRTTCLGRDAWEVELLPPSHKPSTLVLVLDAATGMELESRSTMFGVLKRWTEIEEVEGFDEDIFTWTGDYSFAYGHGDDDPLETLPEEVRDEVARDRRAQDRARPVLAAALAELVVPVPLLLQDVHVSDGDLYGSVEAPLHVHFSRSREPIDREDATVVWQSDGWHWSISGYEATDEVVEAVRKRLASLPAEL